MSCSSIFTIPYLFQVITNCSVTDIKVAEDDFGVRRVQAVETELGTIKTPLVVNCGGKSNLKRFILELWKSSFTNWICCDSFSFFKPV